MSKNKRKKKTEFELIISNITLQLRKKKRNHKMDKGQRKVLPIRGNNPFKGIRHDE